MHPGRGVGPAVDPRSYRPPYGGAPVVVHNGRSSGAPTGVATEGVDVSSDETQAVVDHHMAALQAGDIDTVMEDYTDESVFIINLGGVFTGRDAIRPFFEASGQMPGFTQTAAHVAGDTFYVTWTADGIAFGTDTLVVRDGKIAVQTVSVVLAS
jgi:ketosteroid isomerase-like protein